MEPPLIVEKKESQLWLRFNRPHDENRIDRAAMEMLSEALDSIDDDADINVVVITGSDDYFCSGGRVDPNDTEAEKARYARAITHLHEKLAAVRAPVIAAVSGHCRAGGMAILASADVAIAADDVEFGFPEINHGGFPVMAMATALPLIPPKVALDLFYSGRAMSAREASNLGLVSRIVPRAGLDAAIAEYIATLMTRDPAMLAIGRRAFYAMQMMTAEARMVYGREVLKSVLAPR